MSGFVPTKPVNRRQRIWAALRLLRPAFAGVADLAEAAQVERRAVYAYLQALLAGGYAERRKMWRGRSAGYRLIRDTGADAPRLRADGSPAKADYAETVWRTMKILRCFTLDTLIAHVRMTHDVERGRIAAYTAALTAAGYLDRRGKAEFVLLNNTGCHAPQLLYVREVYDPNLDEIMFREVPEYG